jgi:hypothetical protein
VRLLAVLTVFAFACTTVRVPALTAEASGDAPGSIAPPVVELWLESSDPVAQRESDAAADAARAAIGQALSDVRVDPSALGASDAVLFVRERGVALTSAREHAQTWAKVGIAVGIVVVAAVLVILATKGGHHGSQLTRATPGSAGRAVPVRAPAARPIPRPVILPHGPGVPIFIGLDFVVPVRPVVYRPDPDDEDLPYPPDGPLVIADTPPPPPGDDDAAPPDEPPPRLDLPRLAPPADFEVDERGFFDGPHIGLQLDLLDRKTGEVLWSKPVSSDGNPCDAGDVRKLVRSALRGQAWAAPARRTPPPPPPGESRL